jgi:hypothetical protein
LEDLRKSLVAQGHEDVFFNVILDKASENDLWTITSLCDYPVFVSEAKTSGWDDQGGSDLNERSVTWVYNGDGTLSDPDDLNPWKKGIGVPINMGEFSADVNKALTKALEVQAAFKAQ